MHLKAIETHIVATEDVLGGKPRIVGRRITVADIVVWHEHMGRGINEIAADYDLSLGDIHAALAYYFDNREAIDAALQAEETFIKTLQLKQPSLLKEKLAAYGSQD
ncbi:MAG: DUF433 domain-containing protein [Chloroflexota bacterium]